MRPPRTVLEQKIRERRQTLEEFVASTEQFARENGEPGTLGIRHLQRLVSGRGPNGRPLGAVRPATARLLERIIGLDIDELLAPAMLANPVDDTISELRQMLCASRQVNEQVLDLLRSQLTSIRCLDRQLGAVLAHEEVRVKADQVSAFLAHSPPGATREQLAVLLCELHTLAGWQALDLGTPTKSWQHYESARHAARECGNEAFEIHTAAEQAFVLLDVGETTEAVNVFATARSRADAAPKVLRSWLAAAHGESLAADGRLDASLRSFDAAAELLQDDDGDSNGPYVALDAVHLARWRGHALARLGAPEAIQTLSNALNDLDQSFTRAETSLRIDLARALTTTGHHQDAELEINKATMLAYRIGSKRQQRRIGALER